MPTRCNRVFLLQILLLAQHVSGTTMPIIRSSRVLYSSCCLWYFVLWSSNQVVGLVWSWGLCVRFAGCCFIADLIACSTYFGHHYAHHQELKSIIQWLLPVVFRAVVFQVVGLVYCWGLCVRFAGCCFIVDLIACSTCFGHHYAHYQELKSIIQ